MKKLLLLSLGLVGALGMSSVSASTKCGYMEAKGLTVQADRENGSLYANTLRVNVSTGECIGVKYAYLKNDHPAYNSILTLFLTGQKFHIWVKDSPGIYANAREIEWITK